MGERDGDAAAYFVRRREKKFEVEAGSAAFLREEIERRLPLFEFIRGYPHTYVTTVYFDTADQTLYRRAERSYDDNIKIRVKEYTYRNRDGGYITSPHCFIELKRRSDGTVTKQRLRLAKKRLSRFLAGDDLWEDLVRDASDVPGQLRDIYVELRRHLRRFHVDPTSIVNYRRTVYQASEDELRITFDDEIGVYSACSGLYERAEALTREVLGAPEHRYGKMIVEIKCPEERYPEWLRRALQNHIAKQLSKFTTSVRYLASKGQDSDVLTPDRSPSPPPADSKRREAGRKSAALDDTQQIQDPIEL